MTPADYLAAARVPPWYQRKQTFGPWTMERMPQPDVTLAFVMGIGADGYTILHRPTEATMHLDRGVIVMEDSRRELRKHLPIWLTARGRVLVTGLGLGCVVRGLLANPAVEQIDVVEIDDDILRVIGPEFARDPRVTLHHDDALTIQFHPAARWDFAWHDLWTEDEGLQGLHVQLFARFWRRVGRQGAWAFPRHFAKVASRKLRSPILGAPGYQRWRGTDGRKFRNCLDASHLQSLAGVQQSRTRL